MVNLIISMSSAPLVYLYLCSISVDPKARAQVYWEGQAYTYDAQPGYTEDPDFSLFPYGPLFWTLLLLFLVQFNGRYNCSFHPKSWLSVETAFAIGTIALTAKIFIGPVLEIRKSVLRRRSGKYVQPFLFRIFDLVMIYPVNFLTGIVFKFVYVSLMAVLIVIEAFVGLPTLNKSRIVPEPLFLAWVLVCLGRVSGLLIFRRVRHLWYIPCYGATLVTLFFVSEYVELMLGRCGASVGSIPQYSTLFAGVMGLPPIEFLVGIIGAVLASLFARALST